MSWLDFSRVVLIGSIFYSRHKIVENHDKGIFDKNRAEELILKQEELSDHYQIEGILDVVAETRDAIVKYIDFVASVTERPFILDGYLEARLEGLKFVKETGLSDRVIYNSINPINTREELEAIKDAGIKHAIIFDYDPSYTSPSRRILLLSGDGRKESLIQRAKQLGIKNMMIDVVPTDIKSLGEVIETLLLVKSTYPYPAGCGPANVSYYMADYLKEELDTGILVSSVDSAAQLFSDFLLYGPIERAEIAFQSAYIVEEIKEGLSMKLHEFLGGSHD
ncbi:tetrahydromethanopterin S-methyltransferase subunit H family protein [Geoglobus acetivorans]|uniref:N5-methyltetrahydromethanopterin:coenzyme M methyltransferase subunit H n=1 Tax=Geoglobus acetivorans TaxID=565033 RepID=A0A0A7GED3_GEOAI|nr:N5-methyltetrahydromethanopterin:coenzyme M methyltransferase subunit H [Geoglobus acetivorans]